VFRALLICSEQDCAEVFEAYGSLEELETLACDCGCSLELIEVEDTGGAPARGFEMVPAG
jgi:hypothetical protein